MAVLAAAVCGLLLLVAAPASAEPSGGDWLRLRTCESGNRYDLNTGNGEYGAYQFSLQTWHGLGGVGKTVGMRFTTRIERMESLDTPAHLVSA